jgi:hypothetical protein
MQLGRRQPLAGALFFVFLAVFMIGQAGGGEIYQWVDENGAVWFADSLDKVPPEYRAWAYHKRKNVQEGPSISTPIDPKDPKSELVPAPEPSKSTQDQPANWQERLAKAQAELDGLKAKRQNTQAMRDDMISQWRVRGSRLDVEKEAQAAAEISELDQRIRDKEQEIGTINPKTAPQPGASSGVLSQ